MACDWLGFARMLGGRCRRQLPRRPPCGPTWASALRNSPCWRWLPACYGAQSWARSGFCRPSLHGAGRGSRAPGRTSPLDVQSAEGGHRVPPVRDHWRAGDAGTDVDGPSRAPVDGRGAPSCPQGAIEWTVRVADTAAGSSILIVGSSGGEGKPATSRLRDGRGARRCRCGSANDQASALRRPLQHAGHRPAGVRGLTLRGPRA